MKHLKEWMPLELSEDQIDLLQEGNVISDGEYLYYIGTGTYYKHRAGTNELYMTFNVAILPKVIKDFVEEMSVWILDKLHEVESHTIILKPINGIRRTDIFYGDDRNEYWYFEPLEGPRVIKKLINTTPDINDSVSGGYPKSWVKTSGRFKFPDGQIIDFK